MEDGVEGVGGVSGVEISPRRTAVSVKDDRLSSLEEACKFRDDF